MTEQALLQATDTAIITFLEQLDNTDINNYRHALVLLWQLHADSNVKEQAQRLLEQQIAVEEIQKITKTFSIFDSIISYLPWAGDYKNLQQQNYHAFEANKGIWDGVYTKCLIYCQRPNLVFKIF